MLAVLGSLFLKEKRARERGWSLKAELCVVWMTLSNLQIFTRSVGFSAPATGVTSQCATAAFRARWVSLPCGHTFSKTWMLLVAPVYQSRLASRLHHGDICTPISLFSGVFIEPQPDPRWNTGRVRRDTKLISGQSQLLWRQSQITRLRVDPCSGVTVETQCCIIVNGSALSIDIKAWN